VEEESERRGSAGGGVEEEAAAGPAVPRLGFQSEWPSPPIGMEEADQRSLRQQTVARQGAGGGGVARRWGRGGGGE